VHTVLFVAKKLWTRFTNNRTEHIKMYLNEINRSGDKGGAITYTPLQQMKRDKYMFVRAVYRPRSGDQDILGQVKIQ